MKKLKCFVVDDSVLYRTQVRNALESMSFCEVVCTAADGKFAISKIPNNESDLMVLDLEMPEMDGLETLKQLKQMNYQGKIIMFASSTQRSADVTLEALSLGASDFVAKPGADGKGESPAEKIRHALEGKIKALFPELSNIVQLPVTKSNSDYEKVIWDLMKPKILVIGSSTGGPTALEKIFRHIRGDFNCPVVITQHMPPVFTNSFAKRLDGLVNATVIEAKDGLLLQPNHIYVAPGGYHLALTGKKNFTKTKIIDGEKINSIKPSVDPLFQTAAEIYGENCLGLILTGMGSDGLNGCIEVKNKGGAIYIQDKESCAVWGMPACVHREGAYDKMGNLNQIIDMLHDKVITNVKSLRKSG